MYIITIFNFIYFFLTTETLFQKNVASQKQMTKVRRYCPTKGRSEYKTQTIDQYKHKVKQNKRRNTQ
jgi:hypothetical protein